MAVIHSAVKAALDALRRRTCPKCGHQQTPPDGKAKETVTCEKCGNEIPPKGK